MGSSVGAFVPFAVDVVEAEPLVVTSFAVVVDAEAVLEEEEADSSQAVADLAVEAVVAASPVLAAVKSCNKCRCRQYSVGFAMAYTYRTLHLVLVQ